MRFRLLTALPLVFGAFDLQAQSDIYEQIGSCFSGSRGAVSAISECIAGRWSNSVALAERGCADAKLVVSSCADRIKRCEEGQSEARASFDQRLGQVESTCTQRISQAVLRERESNQSGAASNVLVARALNEEREKVRKGQEARRARAKAALSDFFTKLQESSKLVGKEIEQWRWDDAAGLLVIRRKTESAIVIPFASIATARLTDTKSELDLVCVGDEQCVVFVESNGNMKHVKGVRMGISATNAEALLSSATATVSAFPF